MGAVTWTDPPNRTQIVTDAEPADGAGILSGKVANETDLERFMEFWLECNYSVAPDADGHFRCYILPSYDGGTTFEDGSASVEPARSPDFVIPVRAVTTAQVIAKKNIPIPPSDFKVLVWNATGQTPSSNDLDCYERRYSETVA